MIGRNSRSAALGLLLSAMLTLVCFQTAQSRLDLGRTTAPSFVEATLDPPILNPLVTPDIRTRVRQIQSEPATPKQITENKCCPYPQWSSDSEWILFVDSVGDKGAGLYGVPAEGGPPTFLTDRIGSFSQDLSLVAYPESGLVYIEQWAIGDRWLVPSQGREVYLSHENDWIAWEFGSRSIQHQDLRQRTIWIATIKGENPRELVTVHGGRFLGWIDHSEALLVSGRHSPPSPAGIWRIDRESGAGQLLFETDWPRDVLISPEGGWVAFTVAFQTDQDQNGLWVMRTDGSSIERITAYGSYRWRSEGELLLIPYDFKVEYPYLWQIDLETNRVWALTNPDQTDLPIANNDWQPSPDGQKIVFYSHEDQNLWVMTLPNPPE